MALLISYKTLLSEKILSSKFWAFIICFTIVFWSDVSKITKDDSKQYIASKDYKTKAELSNYLSTIISANFLTKIVTDENYIEQDNKLYCYTPGRGSLEYDESNIELESTTEEEIIANVKVTAHSEGDNKTELNNIITIKKENGKWLIDSYEEK